MFRMPTTFIIGAGASAELNFPTGPTFLEQIADILDFRAQYDRLDSSERFSDLAIAYSRLHEIPNISSGDPFYDAATRVRTAAKVSRSIDNVIDQNDDDPLVEIVGKLAIAYRILEAEAESKLRPVEGSISTFDVASVKDTWLYPLAQMLTTDVRKSQVDQIFDNVTFITFNYDRSIEAFLPSVLMAAYGLDHEVAVGIALRAKIHHPYGQVGTLGWDGADNSEVPYGWLARDRLGEISRELRTFSEKIQENEEISAMRLAIQEAETLVFLGFGFHRQNMRLLAPSHDIQARKIIASVYHEPSPAVETIEREITRLARPLGGRPMPPVHLGNRTCIDLLSEYFLPMTAVD